jgi:hypothetical protein
MTDFNFSDYEKQIANKSVTVVTTHATKADVSGQIGSHLGEARLDKTAWKRFRENGGWRERTTRDIDKGVYATL